MRIVLFLVLSCAISWTVFALGIASAGGGLNPLAWPALTLSADRIFAYILAGSFGPTLAALIMLSTEPKPLKAVKRWAAGFIRLKAPLSVWLFAVFILPTCAIAVLVVAAVPTQPDAPLGLVYLTVAVSPLNAIFAVFLGAGPLGEEPGWRGYATQRMAGAAPDLVIALVIGAVWVIWHAPLVLALPDWRGGQSLEVFIPFYTIAVLSISYLLTKLWRWSRGSLIMVIFVHGIANTVMPYMTNGVFDLDGWSDIQRALLTSAPVVSAALITGVIARTAQRLSQKRQQADLAE